MPALPAYLRRGIPLPGPDILPTNDGQVATRNTDGSFAGWISLAAPEWILAPVSPTVEVFSGQLLYLESGIAIPADMFPWSGTLSSTQIAFAAAFLGIAMQDSPTGSIAPIEVMADGIVEMSAPFDEFKVGQFVAPFETIEALSSWEVHRTAVLETAIGRAVEPRAYTNSCRFKLRTLFS